MDEILRYGTLTADPLPTNDFQNPSNPFGGRVIVVIRVDRKELQDYILLSWNRSPNICEGTTTI